MWVGGGGLELGGRVEKRAVGQHAGRREQLHLGCGVKVKVKAKVKVSLGKKGARTEGSEG